MALGTPLIPALLCAMQDTVYSHGYAKMIPREGSKWASWACWGLGGYWLIWTSQWVTSPDPWDWCEDTTWPWLSSKIQALSFCFTVWRESSFFSSQTIKLKGCDNTIGEYTSPLGRCRGKMNPQGMENGSKWDEETPSLLATPRPLHLDRPTLWVNTFAFH